MSETVISQAETSGRRDQEQHDAVVFAAATKTR